MCCRKARRTCQSCGSYRGCGHRCTPATVLPTYTTSPPVTFTPAAAQQTGSIPIQHPQATVPGGPRLPSYKAVVNGSAGDAQRYRTSSDEKHEYRSVSPERTEYVNVQRRTSSGGEVGEERKGGRGWFWRK